MSKSIILAGPEIFKNRHLGQLISLVERHKIDLFDLYAVTTPSEDLYEFFDIVGDIPEVSKVNRLCEGQMIVLGLEHKDPLSLATFKAVLAEIGGLSTFGVYDATRPAISEFWFGKP